MVRVAAWRTGQTARSDQLFRVGCTLELCIREPGTCQVNLSEKGAFLQLMCALTDHLDWWKEYVVVLDHRVCICIDGLAGVVHVSTALLDLRSAIWIRFTIYA